MHLKGVVFSRWWYALGTSKAYQGSVLGPARLWSSVHGRIAQSSGRNTRWLCHGNEVSTVLSVVNEKIMVHVVTVYVREFVVTNTNIVGLDLNAAIWFYQFWKQRHQLAFFLFLVYQRIWNLFLCSRSLKQMNCRLLSQLHQPTYPHTLTTLRLQLPGSVIPIQFLNVIK